MATAFSDYLFFTQFGPAVIKSVAVLAVDLTDRDMKIIFASQLLEQMFGYEAGELNDKPLDVLLRPEDRVAHREHFAKYQQAHYTRAMNAGVWVNAMRKDSSLFQIQVSLCVQAVGRMDCVIACVADVSNVYAHSHPDPVHH